MILLVEKFKTLGCSLRLKILYLLLKNPEGLFVCEISEILNAKQYNVSKHLNIMKMTMLIEEEKRGRSVLYRVKNAKENIPIFKSILELEKFDKEGIFKFDFKRIKNIVKEKENIRCV